MRLADIATVSAALPFRARIQAEPQGEYVVIQARDLAEDGRVQLQSAARLSALPALPKGGFLHTGDVLFQPRGTRFSAGVLDAPVRNSVVAAAPLWVLRADTLRVVPEFLVALLLSDATQATLRQVAVGTHVPQVPRRAIENLNIALPDLQGQARLVDVARLERRERELMRRLRDARGRLFDLIIAESASKAGKCESATREARPDGQLLMRQTKEAHG